MQNTRLNNLVDGVLGQLGRWLRNPWRRLSLLVISVLFGVFLGTAIPTTTGQAATWDIVAAAILMALTEAISRIVYSNRRGATQSLLLEALNATKLGLIYGMFIEAFKIGS
ncbi:MULTISPECIES: DUF565 domain-containing protein [Trichocoleus]|uniref:DUF565 domain-containing protein n=1 Tax=Trichocoleus desertorum GB2-A4 TaxID=2933944 RepID=A0ABV0J6H3_9CYAN|nr:DUF565 domain-containing protein [Trichocoleus sp. FACHB-46]MBD1863497.1 DUF565 domain-containing protein [Trichocoleus sp. FACHB-46]